MHSADQDAHHQYIKIRAIARIRPGQTDYELEIRGIHTKLSLISEAIVLPFYFVKKANTPEQAALRSNPL